MEEASKKINSYLTFELDQEVFAANVTNVINILEMTKITKVPKSPAYMKGVINLRGNVLPVIDTRLKFEMEAAEITKNTCILVLEVDIEGDHIQVGAIVDAVKEVIEIEPDDIKPPPSIGEKYKSEFITGVAEDNEGFIMIMDMNKVFSTADVVSLRETIEKTDQEKPGETQKEDHEESGNQKSEAKKQKKKEK